MDLVVLHMHAPISRRHLHVEALYEDAYVVVAGDSLSKIAKRFYGDANKWPRIHEANRDQIKNPDLIHPGQKLRIPGA